MNFATIGTSQITEEFIEASKISDSLTLKGVYSRVETKASDFAHKHGAEHVFTDLDEMARSKEFEVVYIASPNSLHFEQTLLFLKNKKHVICEKPIFSNTKEFAEAYKVADENSVYLFEAIRSIHTPNFNILKENLKRTGNISSALFHYLQYSSRYDKFLNGEVTNIFSAQFSGGALVDLGVYPIYIAVGLFGEPNNITYKPVMLSTGVDGSGTLILEYDNFACTILCSKIAQSYIANEIHGEKGTIVFEAASVLKKMDFINPKTKVIEPFSVNQVDKDMVYEIDSIVKIIETNNYDQYNYLRQLSECVLSITEKARLQNNIVFGSER